jgi:hypothetical protein
MKLIVGNCLKSRVTCNFGTGSHLLLRTDLALPSGRESRAA